MGFQPAGPQAVHFAIKTPVQQKVATPEEEAYELEMVRRFTFDLLAARGETHPGAYSVKRWETEPRIIIFNKHHGLSRICINGYRALGRGK
jgi:hypothetical protein